MWNERVKINYKYDRVSHDEMPTMVSDGPWKIPCDFKHSYDDKL